MVYFLIPRRVKYLWLLVTSYYFYMCWNPKYIVLIAFSTVAIYFSGVLLFGIIIFGKYGPKYDKQAFIYFQFRNRGCA